MLFMLNLVKQLLMGQILLILSCEKILKKSYAIKLKVKIPLQEIIQERYFLVNNFYSPNPQELRKREKGTTQGEIHFFLTFLFCFKGIAG